MSDTLTGSVRSTTLSPSISLKLFTRAVADKIAKKPAFALKLAKEAVSKKKVG